jgi:excisionase family DNA binding protein
MSSSDNTPVQLYSVTEAAAYLGSTVESVKAWVDVGALEAHDMGTGRRATRRIHGAALRAFRAKRERDANVDPPEPRVSLSGVYVISATHVRRYKIGYTTDLSRRLASLRTMSPVDLVVVAFIPGARPAVEYGLHQQLADTRLHGEWFAESPELTTLIASHRFVGVV